MRDAPVELELPRVTTEPVVAARIFEELTETLARDKHARFTDLIRG